MQGLVSDAGLVFDASQVFEAISWVLGLWVLESLGAVGPWVLVSLCGSDDDDGDDDDGHDDDHFSLWTYISCHTDKNSYRKLTAAHIPHLLNLVAVTATCAVIRHNLCSPSGTINDPERNI